MHLDSLYSDKKCIINGVKNSKAIEDAAVNQITPVVARLCNKLQKTSASAEICCRANTGVYVAGRCPADL